MLERCGLVYKGKLINIRIDTLLIFEYVER